MKVIRSEARGQEEDEADSIKRSIPKQLRTIRREFFGEGEGRSLVTWPANYLH